MVFLQVMAGGVSTGGVSAGGVSTGDGRWCFYR